MAEEVVQNLTRTRKCEVKFADARIIVDILQSFGQKCVCNSIDLPHRYGTIDGVVGFVDAMNGHRPKEINVVIGYYGYSRPRS